MNRIDRLFGMLTLLQSKKYVTAEKIAEKFQISIRTVYRDIKALSEQGIPVSFEQHKGYCVMQGYFLPPVAFTSDEANALLLMETIVYGFADKTIQENYVNALNKVKAVLHYKQKEKLEQLHSHIKLQLPSCFSINFNYLSILQNAIAAKTVIEIEYKSSSDAVSRRRAEPIGLVFYALSWHLIAWCCLRKEYRDFKLARIVTLRCCDMPFEKKDHITLDEYTKFLPVTY